MDLVCRLFYISAFRTTHVAVMPGCLDTFVLKWFSIPQRCNFFNWVKGKWCKRVPPVAGALVIVWTMQTIVSGGPRQSDSFNDRFGGEHSLNQGFGRGPLGRTACIIECSRRVLKLASHTLQNALRSVLSFHNDELPSDCVKDWSNVNQQLDLDSARLTPVRKPAWQAVIMRWAYYPILHRILGHSYANL